MLTFLRKIRKGFLDSGSTRKYLLYAIGEIALVVTGILIALQINNWNEGRKNLVREREILSALVENLSINRQTILEDIEMLKEFNISSQTILETLDNKKPYHDSLDYHFHLSRVSKKRLYLSELGYEQYKNAGYGMIHDETLRKEVLNLFESTYPQFYSTYNEINEPYDAFIDYYVPLFIYREPDLKPIDFEALYDDQYFIGWIRAYTEGRNTLMTVEADLAVETNRVLELINDELDKSNCSGHLLPTDGCPNS